MNTKESKALIKEIRESIKLSNNKDAIEKCQRLLKADSNNPMGYLLLGAAYQSIDKAEAVKFLRKSIEYTDGPAVVALQGLANCAPREELPQIYDQLSDLVPEKCAEYLDKLFALSLEGPLAQECFLIFKKKAKVQPKAQDNDETERIMELVLKYLGSVWVANEYEVADFENELYKDAMETLLRTSDAEQKIAVYKRYLKWLFKQKNYSLCVRNACKMTFSHPRDVYGYEWICKIYCENHAEDDWQHELEAPIEVYVEQLLALNPNSNLALLIKALAMFEQGQYLPARQLAMQAQQSQPTYSVTLELLARIHIQLGAYKMALLLWQELDEKHESYAQCLSYESNVTLLQEAVRILSNFNTTQENIKALARCYSGLKDMEHLMALPLDKLSQAEFLMEPGKAVEFVGTVDSFDGLLLLGKLYLKIEKFAEALKCMLQATRLKPYAAECFDYLGRLYQATGDIPRARKCYEKCINLNALAKQAVDALSSIYQQLGEEDLNEMLLQNTLRYLTDDDAVRLQYKLGLHFLQVKKYDNAIQCFRTAIKYDFRCMIYWESLGDAYSARGSYNSAIRVFQKILDLSPSNCYAQLQLALIKKTIRMFPEAIVDFESLLHQNPSYMPGLKGIAEAHIGLARNVKAQNRYGRTRQHLQMAINHLQRGFSQGGAQNMVWLWRLTANVFLGAAQLPLSLAYLTVSGTFIKRNEDVVCLARKELLLLSQKFYLCALKLKENTFLWYELAVCCYFNAAYIPEEAPAYLEMASNVCKKAINACNTRWQNWNLLGVINMNVLNENLPLAQHCFIKALTLERKSYTAWTNLGVLYLKLQDIRLANSAFQRAQQSSPVYANAWIGQAMVAELIGDQEEAFDLFRHCQQFEYHPESAIGYAHWVCTVLSDPILLSKPHNRHAIEHMHADTNALDAINWYIQNEESEATIASLTLQGFLCARQNLHHQAINAFTRAYKLLAVGDERDKISTNLGYLYLKTGQPEKAVEAFNGVVHATFKPIIGLALACNRVGQLQDSYSIYNSVLTSVVGEDDAKAATILIAMAAMVYAHQSTEDAKTLLLQSLVLKSLPIQGLYSACAFGVLHNDYEFIGAAIAELNAYDLSENHCEDISYLMAHYYLVKEGPQQALSYLKKRVRMFPQNLGLRKIFGKFLLDYFDKDLHYQLATSHMTLIALSLASRKLKKGTTASEEAETSIYASRALQSVDKKHALKLAQRAIRLNPVNQDGKKLLATILSQ